DIPRTYAGAVFLTAWQGDELVGTGALTPAGERCGQIVRMSVAKTVRRAGIGRAILNELLERARQLGLRRVILETTETWNDAVQFYLAAGFRMTHHQDGDVYFVMEVE
ncbi:MAG TPA: GNAT family N-acetyltransferase, partial [Anaerolineaceae bacterium]|nr:GNAT family N-acetyltransferase [Anaerolineaceae bacterium]